MNFWMQTLLPAVPFLAVVAVTIGVVVIAVRSRMDVERRPDWRRTAWIWLALCWCAGCLYITVVASSGFANPSVTSSPVDLVPFRELWLEGAGLGGIAVLERLANLAMFLVGGFLVALATEWRVGAITWGFLALGAGIEIAQYLLPSSRSVTVDDVLWAVVGGALGALLAVPLRRQRERVERRRVDIGKTMVEQ